MNVEKLFHMQNVLRNRIDYNEPDRFNKLILALLVELGECANEWRGFKFWSTNQEPCTRKSRKPYMNLEDADFYNPLLEEYVDGLHFVLELGIELGYECHLAEPYECRTTLTDHFIDLYFDISDLLTTKAKFDYGILFRKYLTLGERLGFTPEQIEQCYFEKNQINHQRQDQGY